jgi:hypothetical protein
MTPVEPERISAQPVVIDPLENLKRRNAADRWLKIKETNPQRVVADSSEQISSADSYEPATVAPISASVPSQRRQLLNRVTPVEAVPSVPVDHQWKVLPELPRNFEPVPRPSAGEMLPRRFDSATNRWVVAAPDGLLSMPEIQLERPFDSAEILLVAGETGSLGVITADDQRDIVPSPLAPLLANSQLRATSSRNGGGSEPKSIGFRGLSEIRPFYDLEKDRRIREYAAVKAKEYRVFSDDSPFPLRQFAPTLATWDATDFYHYPLYFEDANLERYGHTYGDCAQPFVSIARFSGQFLMLPYQMTLDPVCTPKYSLGYYRPGDCAPFLHERMPFSWKAAGVEAGVVTGLILLIP